MNTRMARRAFGVAMLAGLLIAVLAGAWWWRGPSEAQRQALFSIPPGTAARLAAGETVEVLPSTINLTLNQRDILVIRNDDSVPVQIGPFTIDPGQRFSQRYYNRGTYELMCTIHADQRLRVVVE